MFKPVHGIDGYLTAAISNADTVLFVDDTTLSLLRRRLGVGDHTYLLIRAAYDYEIVKVVSVGATSITVARPQDGTLAQPFASGAGVEFVLSNAAVVEIIQQEGMDEITLQGGGIVTVTKNAPNNYTVSAPAITITSTSPNVLVGGEFPTFTLSAPLLVDCCD